MAADPASYGMTDTMGRMHSDAQFAGSSSVPAHVEMMGLIGMGNNYDLYMEDKNLYLNVLSVAQEISDYGPILVDNLKVTEKKRINW